MNKEANAALARSFIRMETIANRGDNRREREESVQSSCLSIRPKVPLSQWRRPHLQNHDLPWWPNFLRGDQNFRRQFSEQSSQVKWAWNKQNVNTSVTKSLPRHASWCHLLHLGLAQSKPGWSAQAFTRQSQAAIDGARGLVWLAS